LRNHRNMAEETPSNAEMPHLIHWRCMGGNHSKVCRCHPETIPPGITKERRGKVIADFDLLVEETSIAFMVPPEDILGPRRTQLASLARHVVMALWADFHPYQDASNRCNRGCHSTAMWARQRVLNMAEIDDSFASILRSISRRCQHDYFAMEEPETEETKDVKYFSVCA